MTTTFGREFEEGRRQLALVEGEFPVRALLSRSHDGYYSIHAFVIDTPEGRRFMSTNGYGIEDPVNRTEGKADMAEQVKGESRTRTAKEIAQAHALAALGLLEGKARGSSDHALVSLAFSACPPDALVHDYGEADETSAGQP